MTDDQEIRAKALELTFRLWEINDVGTATLDRAVEVADDIAEYIRNGELRPRRGMTR
jgi:hypothetical protein